MLFNSIAFLVFLAILVPAYYLARGRRRQHLLLLAASLFFYGWWNVPFTGLLVGSALFAWWMARQLSDTNSRAVAKACLVLSVTLSLGLLAYFKYYNFFIDSLNQSGVVALSHAHILLPLGISFYTFQCISYVVDVYRRDVSAERNPLNVVLYVSFFPQLVAGPIVRARDFLPQLNRPSTAFDADDLVWGARRVLTGLLKKVVVADNLARTVDVVYAAPAEYSWIMLLLATYAFAIQIYFDFSAYSDIAIGVARLFGFRLNENFDRPYISQSIQEFWRRWHISLSNWLRDYLYIPLGGSRWGTWATYRNLLITMVLGGLWHGASINFVIWGLIHGLWLAAERAWVAWRQPGTAIAPVAWLKTLLVFHGVCLSWVFFRAQSVGDAGVVIGRIAGLQAGQSLPALDFVMQMLLCCVVFAYLFITSRLPVQSRWWYLMGAYALVAIIMFGVSSTEFIYFVF